MRPISTLAAATGLFLLVSTSAAHAAKPLPNIQNVASTDDCFAAYSDNGKHCELSYCLGSVMGDKEETKLSDFEGCSSRTLASLPAPEEAKSPQKGPRY